MACADHIPEYSATEERPLERLEAVAAALATALDGAQVTLHGRAARGALQTEASADVLSVRGALRGRKVVLRFRELNRPEANLFGTTVDVAVDASPMRVDLFEGWAAGPALPTSLAGHRLQGAPRSLVLELLDAATTARLAAHHATELHIGAAGLTLKVTGWVDDAGAALALVELAVVTAERATEVIERAVRARAASAGHGDSARALAELRTEWAAEAAASKASTERSGRRAGLLVIAALVVLVALGATLLLLRS